MWMDHFVNTGKDVEHEAFLLYWMSKFVFVRTQILVQDLNVAIHLSRGMLFLLVFTRNMRMLRKLRSKM